MSVVSKPMKFNSRFVAPNAPADNVCTDLLYSVYAYTYEDCLKRVQDGIRDRPYVEPPAFSSSKSVTRASWALQRRLYAMYSDVVKGLDLRSSVPGYCYMQLFPEHSLAVKLAEELGPYPTVSEVDHALTLHNLPKCAYVSKQEGGVLHVHSSVEKAIGGSVRYVSDIRQFGAGWRIGGSTYKRSSFGKLADGLTGRARVQSSLQVPPPQVVLLQSGSCFIVRPTRLVRGSNIIKVTSTYMDMPVMGVVLSAGHALELLPTQRAVHSCSSMVGSDTETVLVQAVEDTQLMIHDPVMDSGTTAKSSVVQVYKAEYNFPDLWDSYRNFVDTASILVSRSPPRVGSEPRVASAVKSVEITDPLWEWAPVFERRLQVKRGVSTPASPCMYYNDTVYPVLVHSVRSDHAFGSALVSGVVSTSDVNVRIAAIGFVTVEADSSGLPIGRSMSVRIEVPEGDYAFDCAYGDSD